MDEDNVNADTSLADLDISRLNDIECIVSWNLKHLVNDKTVEMINSINMELGYNIIEIKSPKKIMEGDNNEGK